MRVSISVSDFSWPGGPAEIGLELGSIARAADNVGVHTVWLPDHLIQVDPHSTPEADVLETYTTLGFIAAQTTRVRLGAMVTPVAYRPPAVLVKSVTTLDVLSGGRAWFGVGAGYSEDEARWMGMPFPPVAERFERLEETLQIAFQMWAGDVSAFQGAHYRLEHPINNPPPLQRPRPPVLIGGSGERRTLRLVARFGDACNLPGIPDGGKTIRHKLAVLAQHCADFGRSTDEIDTTVSTRLAPGESPAGFADRCAEFADYGIRHVILFGSPWTAGAVQALGDFIHGVEGITA